LYESGAGGDQFRLQGYFTRYNFKLFSNFTLFLEDPENGDMIEQTDRRQIHGLNGSYRFEHAMGGLAHAAATLGGGYRADDVDVSLWQSPDRVRAERLVDSGIGERNLYLWAQDELQLGPRVRLQLGVRWDYFTFDVDDRLDGVPADLPHASGYAQQTILSPKASLVVSPVDRLDLFANVGSGFHSNDARDIVIDRRVAGLVRSYRRDGVSQSEIEERLSAQNYDPAHLDVETLPRALGGEIGLRARPLSALNLAAAAWFIDLEREFVYVGDGGFTELSGRSRRYGLDLEARVGFNDWLSADADVSLSRGELRDEPESANEIPLAPRLTWTGGVNAIRPQRWDASIRYVHIGNRPANEGGSVTAQGFTIFNLIGGYHLGAVRLNLTLENLFNTEWNEAQFDTESRLPGEALPVSELHFTPGTPRNLRLGLSLFF
jgi:outer membrane receptor protein involved in Fe transport